MPLVRIYIETGKTSAYKRALLHGVRGAITQALRVGGERVMQRVVETPAEDLDIPSVKTDRFVIVDITMFPGRDADTKAELFRTIARNLGLSPGIEEEDIMIVLHDPPKECWGICGRASA